MEISKTLDNLQEKIKGIKEFVSVLNLERQNLARKRSELDKIVGEYATIQNAKKLSPEVIESMDRLQSYIENYQKGNSNIKYKAEPYTPAGSGNNFVGENLYKLVAKDVFKKKYTNRKNSFTAEQFMKDIQHVLRGLSANYKGASAKDRAYGFLYRNMKDLGIAFANNGKRGRFKKI